VKTLDFNSSNDTGREFFQKSSFASMVELLEYSKKSDCAMEAKHVFVQACPNVKPMKILISYLSLETM